MQSKLKMLVDCSQPLHTPPGKVLRKMWYGSFLDVLNDDEYSGLPNNGPEHTLRLKMTHSDLCAFFDLVREGFQIDAAEEFVQSIMAKLTTEPVRMA